MGPPEGGTGSTDRAIQPPPAPFPSPPPPQPSRAPFSPCPQPVREVRSPSSSLPSPPPPAPPPRGHRERRALSRSVPASVRRAAGGRTAPRARRRDPEIGRAS